MKTPLRSAIAVALSLAAAAALAQTTGAPQTLEGEATLIDRAATSAGNQQVAGRIAQDFTPLAGSEANAEALVSGLRRGTPIELTETTTTTGSGGSTTTTTTTTITPGTKPMGFGNITVALALAEKSLAQAGITEPTAEQLKSALTGGSLTVDGKTVDMKGVLALRAEGMGWGKIANTLGVRLGSVMSAVRSERAKLSTTAAQDGERGRPTAKGEAPGREKAERAEKTERAKVERAERAERAERMERAERPERPQRPERVERVERPEKMERGR